jgi:hypothetical protein
MTETYYNKILVFARSYINGQRLNVAAEDAISEAFITCPDPNDFDLFKTHIVRSVLNLGRSNINYIQIGHSAPKDEKTKVCENCHNELPAYYFNKAKVPPFHLWAICKKCQYEKWKEWAKDVDPNHMRNLWNKANKKYQSRPEIKEEHNAAMRYYVSVQRQNLTDQYIKTLLRGRGMKTADITPEIIEMERENQLKKRRQS